VAYLECFKELSLFVFGIAKVDKNFNSPKFFLLFLKDFSCAGNMQNKVPSQALLSKKKCEQNQALYSFIY
jgi:hypothetical protein